MTRPPLPYQTWLQLYLDIEKKHNHLIDNAFITFHKAEIVDNQRVDVRLQVVEIKLNAFNEIVKNLPSVEEYLKAMDEVRYLKGFGVDSGNNSKAFQFMEKIGKLYQNNVVPHP